LETADALRAQLSWPRNRHRHGGARPAAGAGSRGDRARILFECTQDWVAAGKQVVLAEGHRVIRASKRSRRRRASPALPHRTSRPTPTGPWNTPRTPCSFGWASRLRTATDWACTRPRWHRCWTMPSWPCYKPTAGPFASLRPKAARLAASEPDSPNSPARDKSSPIGSRPT
jgi:hypothetical protein